MIDAARWIEQITMKESSNLPCRNKFTKNHEERTAEDYCVFKTEHRVCQARPRQPLYQGYVTFPGKPILVRKTTS